MTVHKTFNETEEYSLRSIAILGYIICSQIKLAHVTLPKAVLSIVKIFAVYEAEKVPIEILDRHPKNLSLREFMCNFSKKWKCAPANVFINTMPTYLYIIKKKQAIL